MAVTGIATLSSLCLAASHCRGRKVKEKSVQPGCLVMMGINSTDWNKVLLISPESKGGVMETHLDRHSKFKEGFMFELINKWDLG